jgi:hypothetical protein
MKKDKKTALYIWIKESIENKTPPFDCDIITVDKVRFASDTVCATQSRVEDYLRACGAADMESFYIVNGVFMRFWVLRNHELYKTPEQIKNAIDKFFVK